MSKNAGNIVLEAKNVVYYYKANKGKKSFRLYII